MDMTILPRKAIVTVVLACSVFNVQASNDGMDAGKIHFTGSIIEPSCEIDGDGDTNELTIPLGTYPTTYFTDPGKESTFKPFSIKLQKCPVATPGLGFVQLTFNGTTVTGRDDLLSVSKITTPGSIAATGIGVAITTKEEPTVYIKFDGSDDQVYIALPSTAGNPIQADFLARYQSYDANVTAGPADADLTINILYR